MPAGCWGSGGERNATKRSTEPTRPGNQNRSLVLDPAGQFAYVSNPNLNTESVFSIDANTEVLAEIPCSPFSAGMAKHKKKQDRSNLAHQRSTYKDEYENSFD